MWKLNILQYDVIHGNKLEMYLVDFLPLCNNMAKTCDTIWYL